MMSMSLLDGLCQEVLMTRKGGANMQENNFIEIACYEREHLSHDMFAVMDWEMDSIMRELDDRRYLPEAK